MFVERTILKAKEVDLLNALLNTMTGLKESDQKSSIPTNLVSARGVVGLGNVPALRRLEMEGLISSHTDLNSVTGKSYTITHVGMNVARGEEENLFMESRILPLLQIVSWLTALGITILSIAIFTVWLSVSPFLVIPVTALIVFVARKLFIAKYREDTLEDMHTATKPQQSRTDIFRPPSEEKEIFIRKTHMNK